MSYIGQGLPADTFQGFTTDSFTGDGSATTFTLSKEPFSEDTLIVVINNVIQKPTTNFTVSGTTLTIVGTAVADGDVIYAIHMGGPLPIGGASELDLNGASDKLILDEDADTTISADTDDQIDIKVGDADILNITNSSSDAVITQGVQDKDILFKGNDGGSAVTALTLDMSDAGAATLNNGLTLSDGDLSVASGHGISFASAAGGTYADASGMASELLDDYEEGTWTGTFRSSAGHFSMNSSYQTGNYTRIGNIVTVKAYLVGSSEGLTDSDSVLVDGLPYVAVSGNVGYQAITIGYLDSASITAGHAASGYVNSGTNQIQLTMFDVATGTSSMTVGELTGNGQLIFTATYRVA